MRVVARVLAPAPSRSVVSGLSPFIAAQWSAVMPSPCAVFTSAPCLISAITAAASPRSAASATATSRADSIAAPRTMVMTPEQRSV